MPMGITRVITVVIETVETLVLLRRGAPSEGPAATPEALDERIAADREQERTEKRKP